VWIAADDTRSRAWFNSIAILTLTGERPRKTARTARALLT
jgi:hypothetical protein